jgi:hypothetical protein
MVSTLCLLTCALAVGQAPDREWLLVPQLARGQELVYSGTFSEEDLGPGVQLVRAFRVDTTVLVLDVDAQKYNLAFLTTVTSKTPRSAGEPNTAGLTPSSVRLEVLAMDRQGRLLPSSGAGLAVPLDGPATIECGAFVEVPKYRVGINAWWEANEDGRTPRTWRVDGAEIVNNVSCVRLVGVQQSEDWNKPRADHVAWQRRDTVWISPQLGTTCRFERVVERRDGAHETPTHRAVLHCDLESSPGLTYLAKFFDDRKHEIEQARKFSAEAEGFLREPLQHKNQLEGILKRIKQYTDAEPATPYRKAVVQVQKRIEAALRGETIPDPQADTVNHQMKQAALGQRVPDFVGTDLLTHQTHRLQRLLGKPVLVVFYDPATENGRKVLRYGQAVTDRYPRGMTLLPMAVTDDVDLVRQQHQEMKLQFPVLDGTKLYQLFAVDGLPRLIVLDGQGIVRGAYTGWGAHTAGEVTELLQRWMPK